MRQHRLIPNRHSSKYAEKGFYLVTVLGDVPLLQWLLLAAALVAYGGPGMALVAWGLRIDRRLDFTQQAIVGFALSLSLWAVLFSAFSLTQVALPPIFAWLFSLGGWLLYAWLSSRGRCKGLAALLQDGTPLLTALLWLIAAATVAVSLWSVRGVVVQPGSDGYHHTLIAQAIVEQGRLPDGLTPLTSVLTFTYHFGYHLFVAVMEWMTGISVVALVPILAQVLKAGAALAAAFLAEAMSGRRSAGVVAAVVVGLVCVFPAYYVNWGRNTQLTGLLLVAVLLGVVWLWCLARPRPQTIALIAFLAIGLALAHYRVTLMAAIGCALVVGARSWQARWSWTEWRLRLIHISGMVLGALLFIAPWVWRVWSNRQIGYSAAIAEPQASFFTLERLGALVLNYPTNWPLIFVCGIALGYGLWKRDLGVWVLTVWSLLLYILSQPWAISQYMDTVTVIQSLFLPGAVVIGLAAALFMIKDGPHMQWRSWAVAGTALVLSLLGGREISQIVEPGAPYVLPGDMPAVQWVAQNTPEDALFMVNTYTFDFAPQFIIGSDAGGWLPVLAKRRVVTAPMTFSIERNVYADYPARVQELSLLGGDLTTPAALAALQQAGVTHVFVGQRGGPIQVDKLLASPAYALDYQAGSNYVFRLLQPPS
jgi:hypothetical protein